LLLFTRKLSVGFLGWRFVRESSFIEYAGFAITVAGALLAVWARVYIGRNWSSNVTIKQNHELIQGGPYALVRHPIYSGLLLATLGTAITIGEVRGLIALPLSFAGWQMKSMVEERFMREQFGRQYVDYERRVRALIPFVY
jgi:protein-S-isoprenylcysteine O-methyltransferase